MDRLEQFQADATEIMLAFADRSWDRMQLVVAGRHVDERVEHLANEAPRGLVVDLHPPDEALSRVLVQRLLTALDLRVDDAVLSAVVHTHRSSCRQLRTAALTAAANATAAGRTDILVEDVPTGSDLWSGRVRHDMRSGQLHSSTAGDRRVTVRRPRSTEEVRDR